MTQHALDFFVRFLFLPSVLVVASLRLVREIVVFIRESKVQPTQASERAASGRMAPASPSSARVGRGSSDRGEERGNARNRT